MSTTNSAARAMALNHSEQISNADNRFYWILWAYSICCLIVFCFDIVPGLLVPILLTAAHTWAFLIYRWHRWRVIFATQCVLFVWFAAQMCLIGIVYLIYAFSDPDVTWQQ